MNRGASRKQILISISSPSTWINPPGNSWRKKGAIHNSARWARTLSGGQVVVITGTGHADRIRGMPAKLLIADPEARILSLGQFEAAPDAPEAFDAHMLAAAPDRDDPCAVFRDREAE